MPTIIHELQSTTADYQLSPNSCWWACMKVLRNRYWGHLHGGWWRFPWEVDRAFEPIDGRLRREPNPARYEEVRRAVTDGLPLDPSYWFLYGLPPSAPHFNRLCRLFPGWRFLSLGTQNPSLDRVEHFLRTFGPMVVVSRLREAGRASPAYCHAVVLHGLDYSSSRRTSDATMSIWNPDRGGAVLPAASSVQPYGELRNWIARGFGAPMFALYPRIDDAPQRFRLEQPAP